MPLLSEEQMEIINRMAAEVEEDGGNDPTINIEQMADDIEDLKATLNLYQESMGKLIQIMEIFAARLEQVEESEYQTKGVADA